MDFHTLTRRELQSLCKLNKIPANLTNVAMADALKSLEIVVGIEEYLNVSHPETADTVEPVVSVEPVEPVEVSSPKAPQTRCRTSTRQKAKPTEAENAQTTRRGSKQLPREVEESKTDQLKTPAVSRTSRKVPATLTRRNVDNQLNECENEPKEEGLVENRYSTRRSTRVTDKKSAAPRVKKGADKAVKIDSCLDQGNSNAEEEDMCNAFEKLDVVVIQEEAIPKIVEEDEDLCEDVDPEDKSKTSEVKNDVKPESDGTSSQSEEDTHKTDEEDEDWVEVNKLEQDVEDKPKNSEVKRDEVCDLKPESYDMSSLCEDGNLVQKVDSRDGLMSVIQEDNPVMVQEEHSDADDASNQCENSPVMVQEEHSDADDASNPCEKNPVMVQEEHVDADDTSNPCENNPVMGQDEHSDADDTSNPFENNPVMGQEEHSDADDTSNPCEDEKFEIQENNVVTVEEIFYCVLESGVDTEMGHQDTPCANSEMQEHNVIVQEEHLDADNTSNPCEDEKFEVQENNVVTVEEIFDFVLESGVDTEMGHQDTPCANSEMQEHNPVTVQEEHSDADDTSNPCEDEKIEIQENNVVTVEENFDCVLESGVDTEMEHQDTLCANSEMQEHNPVMVQEEHSDADDTSNPCEDEKFEIQENNVVTVEEIFDCILESGVDTEMGHQDTSPCANLEINNDSSTMIIDNTENLIDEINETEMEEVAENTVNETVDATQTMTEEVEGLKRELFSENYANEKSDAGGSGPTQTPLIFSDVTSDSTHVTLFKKGTPFKNMTEELVDEKVDADSGWTQNPLISSQVTGHPTLVTPFKNIPSVVSDDKENIVNEGKIIKKEKDENEKINYNEISIRQLKKQLKALTIKSLNSKDEATATRPALQPLCENQTKK